jgi:hypothetical protein
MSVQELQVAILTALRTHESLNIFEIIDHLEQVQGISLPELCPMFDQAWGMLTDLGSVTVIEADELTDKDPFDLRYQSTGESNHG